MAEVHEMLQIASKDYESKKSAAVFMSQRLWTHNQNLRQTIFFMSRRRETIHFLYFS